MGTVAYIKDVTELPQVPTASPYDTFATGCTHILKRFVVKQCRMWHGKHDQI
jgi:hypothetical protein